MRFWLLFFVLVSVARSQDLKIYPYLGTPAGPFYDEAKHHGPTYRVFLVLFNNGKSPLTVLTQGGHPRGYNPLPTPGKEHPRIIFSFEMYHSYGGQPVVPSLPSFEPVELQPGELTEVQLDVTAPENFDYNAAIFEYGVSDELGRRFKIWSGTAKSPMVKQRPRQSNDTRLP